jgi:peptidoglycan/xylan/chitin deacetylase (PgdA/CDA1 family)
LTLEQKPLLEREFVGYGRTPPKVAWPNGARVALSFVVNYEEGSEYSLSNGDDRNDGQGEFVYNLGPGIRDLGTESIYEYGSRAGIWRVLRTFKEYDVAATFFACGVALERNPDVGKAIREDGHEPCSHGWRWSEPWLFSGPDEEREHIRRAVQSIEAVCGERPVGWYWRYSPTVHTRRLLVEEGGFLYDSDSYADDLPYFVSVGDRQHLVIPYNLVSNDGRVIFQGSGTPADFVNVCASGLRELHREGKAGYPKMMSVGLHPRWIGQPARAAALREFIEIALGLGGVWFARRDQIARWWIDKSATFVRGVEA